MQKRKKLKARILSLAMSVMMTVTMTPTPVFAVEGGTTPETGDMGVIYSFDKLEAPFAASTGKNAPSHVYGLTVELDTPLEELGLPAELTAMVARTTVVTEPEETTPEESAPEETTPEEETIATNSDADKAEEETKENIEENEIPLAPKPEQDEEKVVTIIESEVIPVEWNSDKEYVSDEKGGPFIFTAKLPEGYILADGVKAPQIYVFVGNKAARAGEPHDALTGKINFNNYSENEDCTTLSGHSGTPCWSWEYSTKTLTLNGVTSSNGSSYTCFDLPLDSTITLADGTTNTLSSGGQTIYGWGNTTINGGGTLDVTANNDIAIRVSGTLTIDGGIINATAKGGTIQVSGVVVNDGTVNLISTENLNSKGAIHSVNESTPLTVNGGSVTATTQVSATAKAITNCTLSTSLSVVASETGADDAATVTVADVNDPTKNYKYVKIAPSYDYEIDLATATSGDGYTLENGVLTLTGTADVVYKLSGNGGSHVTSVVVSNAVTIMLDGVTIAPGNTGIDIKNTSGEVKLILKDNTVNTFTKSNYTTLQTSQGGNLTITCEHAGDDHKCGETCGTLTMESKENGILTLGDLYIAGGTVTVTTDQTGIRSIAAITIIGGEVTSTSEGSDNYNSGITAEEAITISGAKVIATGTYRGITSSKAVTISDGAKVTAFADSAGFSGVFAISGAGGIILSGTDTVVKAAGFDGVMDPEPTLNDGIVASGGDYDTYNNVWVTWAADTSLDKIVVDGTNGYTLDAAGLQKAFEDIADQGTIEIGQTITLNDGITHSTAKKVTLDLKGQTISYPSTGAQKAAIFALSNAAELNITDSSTNGKITVSKNNIAIVGMEGSGNVTVQGGTLETTNPGSHVIDHKGTGKVTMEGGTLQTTWGSGINLINSGSAIVSGGEIKTDIGNCVVTEGANSRLNITGGVLSATGDGDVVIGNAGKIIISGGTLSASEGGALVSMGAEVTVSQAEGKTTIITSKNPFAGTVNLLSGTTEITGGQIRNTSSNGTVIYSDTGGKASLKGGSFEVVNNGKAIFIKNNQFKVSQFIADGYKAFDKEDNELSAAALDATSYTGSFSVKSLYDYDINLATVSGTSGNGYTLADGVLTLTGDAGKVYHLKGNGGTNVKAVVVENAGELILEDVTISGSGTKEALRLNQSSGSTNIKLKGSNTLSHSGGTGVAGVLYSEHGSVVIENVVDENDNLTVYTSGDIMHGISVSAFTLNSGLLDISGGDQGNGIASTTITVTNGILTAVGTPALSGVVSVSGTPVLKAGDTSSTSTNVLAGSLPGSYKYVKIANLAAYTGTEAAAPNSTPTSKTGTSITLASVSVGGENVEYAKSTTSTPPTLDTDWQDSTTFTGLTSDTTYYFFARVAANGTHKPGAASTGTPIKTNVAGAYDYEINLGDSLISSGDGYTYDSATKTLTLTGESGKTYKLSGNGGSNVTSIVVNNAVTITLDGVTVTSPNGVDKTLNLSGSSTTLKLKGINTITNGGADSDFIAAVYSPESLTIQNADDETPGTLIATGGTATKDGGSSSGIRIDDRGSLTIEGGVINATGGTGTAEQNNASYGIRSANNVSISGGVITAIGVDSVSNGGEYTNSCGIWAGGGASITGGTITAESGAASNITSGIFSMSDAISVTGGSVTATGGFSAMGAGLSVGTPAPSTLVAGATADDAAAKTAAEINAVAYSTPFKYVKIVYLPAYDGTEAAAPSGTPVSKTATSVTLTAVTVTGETVEYAKSTTSTAPTSDSDWQTATEFTSLTADTTYYFFARVKESNTHKAGVASAGTAIKTNIAVAFSSPTANGTSGTTTTTELTLTFDKDVAGLTVGDITLTGATKGMLTKQSGTGVYKLTITNITVANGANVNVAVAKTGFTFTPANEDVVVNVAPVTVPVTSIALNKNITTLTVGDTETLTATVAPANATNKAVTWSSSKIDVATVNNGVVTAVAVGTANITVTTVDGSFVETCVVTVSAASLTDAEKVAVAKPLAESAVEGITATNSTTADHILSSVTGALSGTGVTATWKAGSPTITQATTGAVGSITGTIVLTCGAESVEVTVNKTIAKLNSRSSSDNGSSTALLTSLPPSYQGSTKIIDNVIVPDYTIEGNWKKDVNGNWSFSGMDGNSYAGGWAPVFNPFADVARGQNGFDWFLFDANGRMRTGWYTDSDGNTYYLNPTSDNTLGAMQTGWVLIDGKYYYFNEKPDGTRGKLLKNTNTPDGYWVDKNGIWDKKEK